MTYYCTLFNSYYLSRGLVTAESLTQASPNSHLFIFTFDDLAYEVLQALNLERVTLVQLAELEAFDKELFALKDDRTLGEYCWTSTSCVLRYAIQKFNLPHCTYIDADMYFYQSPEILLKEVPEDHSVMITEHRYDPKYNFLAERAGKYCVQFMYFKNDEKGMAVLNWWRDACLEWCYNRIEDGKFGDQKYLDNWTTQFEGVWELQNEGGGVAPWNMEQYYFSSEGKEDKIFLKNKNKNELYGLVFFHFHNLKMFSNATVFPRGRYSIEADTNEIIFLPYIEKLNNAKKRINAIDNSFDPHGVNSIVSYNLKNRTIANLHHIKRSVRSWLT